MYPDRNEEPRFIVDRMLGTLCRYLRLMGYDAVSANSRAPGDRREDTRLVEQARTESRLLLTKDRELARRAGELGILIQSDDVLKEVRQLADERIIRPDLRLSRCSLCNSPLRPAEAADIAGSDYAPAKKDDLEFFWCDRCCRLYWTGSHSKNLEKRLTELQKS
jgi:uncharacterized protein with PIN domain